MMNAHVRSVVLAAMGGLVTVLPVAAAAPPNPPATLSGSVNGSTVTLNWLSPVSPDPITSYVIEAGSSAGASNITVFDTGNVTTTLTATAVPTGTYFVRVRAKNESGVSPASNEIVITVGSGGPCAPNPPTALAASVSGFSITFTWTGAAGACPPTGYTLVAGSTSGASDLARISLGPTPTSFTAPAVPPGRYFVRVHALTETGPSPASNEVTVTIGSLRGEVTDAVGDAIRIVPNPPDLVSGSADVLLGNMAFTVRLAAGTFDPQTTILSIYLDTDQNPSTGTTGFGGLGVDYLIFMNAQNMALVQRFSQTWTTVGVVPVNVRSDGKDVSVPLSLLGNDDGRLDFKIWSFITLSNTTLSGGLDSMPDLALPPGRVQ